MTMPGDNEDWGWREDRHNVEPRPMTDTSKEGCEALAKRLRLRATSLGTPRGGLDADAADLITALQERVAEVERERDGARELAHGFCSTMESKWEKLRNASADLAEALEVVNRIRNARAKYAATGFPMDLYPDPATWMEDQCDALLAKHGAPK